MNGEIQLTLQGILQDYSLGSLQGDRYARGEIDKEEYERTLTDLRR